MSDEVVWVQETDIDGLRTWHLEGALGETLCARSTRAMKALPNADWEQVLNQCPACQKLSGAAAAEVLSGISDADDLEADDPEASDPEASDPEAAEPEADGLAANDSESGDAEAGDAALVEDDTDWPLGKHARRD
jgi:hypothetical protein